MGNELTSLGNILFAITSLVGILFFHHWLKTKTLTDNTRTVVRAWIQKDIAVAIRIGWWILALLLAEKGETYNAFFVEHKHWVTVPTSLLYVYAQVQFIDHIIDIPRWKRYGLMWLVIGAAGVITWVGF